MNRFIILLLCLLPACKAPNSATQPEAAMNDTSQSKDRSSEMSTPVAAANERFVLAFAAGDARAASSHFAEDGVWYLTNGTAISGRASIEAFLAKAHADGAGAFAFSARQEQPVGEHRYTVEQFAFDLSPGKTVKGTRYALWSESGAKLVRDAWVPRAPASGELASAIEARTAELASAYNSGDAAALRSLYAADGTVVLSSGTVIDADGLGEMLEQTAAMGISDMRFGAQSVYAAGDAAYAIGDFDVTLPTPDGDVPLSGTRLMLWRKNASGWQVALELSWPRAQRTASIEAGGMKFEWSFKDDKLMGRIVAPTNGWVAVGFNDEDALAGSRLVMARIDDGRVIAEEHIAQPPNHHDIRTLGAPQTLSSLSGRLNGVIDVEFALDRKAVGPADLELRPGQRVWLTLAFSEHPDFDHHSRFRTARAIQL